MLKFLSSCWILIKMGIRFLRSTRGRKAILIVKMIAKKTKSKLDDKIINQVEEALKYINSGYEKNNKNQNELIATEITHNENEFKDLRALYFPETAEFGLNILGTTIKYNPKNGNFDFKI